MNKFSLASLRGFLSIFNIFGSMFRRKERKYYAPVRYIWRNGKRYGVREEKVDNHK